MVPMMVYLLRMSMHVAIGTDLFQILFTGAGLTIMQAVTNQTVDVVLALLIAVGSTIGAQIGARVARLLRGEQLKIVLASIVLLVTCQNGNQPVGHTGQLALPSGRALGDTKETGDATDFGGQKPVAGRFFARQSPASVNARRHCGTLPPRPNYPTELPCQPPGMGTSCC